MAVFSGLYHPTDMSMLQNMLKQQQQQRQFEQKMAMEAPLTQAQTEKAQAEASRERTLAELPFAGRQMPGAAGRYMALDMIGQKYGYDSTPYLEAKADYDLEKDKMRQTMEYQKSLMESQPKRYATPMAKMVMEQQEIEQGLRPGSTSTGGPGERIEPEVQKKLSAQYKQKLTKDITDPDTRKRAIFATNMEKTLDNLNVDHLVGYSGLKGSIELLNDKRNALKGKPTQRYQDYKNALTAANTLAKQVRQFYGDSITPSVQEGLKHLVNPSSWMEHPDVAKGMFNQFKKILETEADTFFDVLGGREELSRERKPAEQQQEAMPEKMSAGSKILAKDLEVPKFATKEEAVNWYNQQPKTVQNAIKLKYQGGK